MSSDVKEEDSDYDFAIPKIPSRRKRTRHSMSEEDEEIKPQVLSRGRAGTFMESVIIPRRSKFEQSTRTPSATQTDLSTAGTSKAGTRRRAKPSDSSSAAAVPTTKVGRSDEEDRPKRPISPTVGRSPPVRFYPDDSSLTTHSPI